MEWDLLGIVGVLTIVATYSVKLIGYPDQIRKVRRLKSVKELSLPLFSLSVASYSLWTVYGILKKDWIIVAGQGLGVVITIILLREIFLRKEKEKE
jgi:MtN3 and saliva related transmembrane protein